MDHPTTTAEDKQALLPPLPEYADAALKETKKPRLTLKILFERMQELQKENLLLSQRLDELENRLKEGQPWCGEAAASAETAATGAANLPFAPETPFIQNALTEARLPEIEVQPFLRRSTNSALIAEAEAKTIRFRSDALPSVETSRSERHPARKKTFWRFFRLLARIW
ncbi:hypothetical protein [Paenibacillus sp. MBLB4367]|uniref:hypothetical protein n=1 Tax=Paenibacillus sp. MBLB4367 TaxID=3384767 RepID=UPI0039081D32